MLTPAQAKRILERRKRDSTASNLLDSCFPQQRAFIDDPAKLKSLFCTRRAAKSYTLGYYLVRESLENPGCNCLFIGLTRDSAKGIVWKDILHTINRKHKLKAKFNLQELTMTFPNGSIIKVAGADVDENEMNKFLGKKYKLVCIDEASMYTVNIRHMVYDILGPAMADLMGTICLAGTASNFTRGLFYDITTGKEQGWSNHSWSAHDNPYVPWQKFLDEIRVKRPLYMETPQYRQWYLNIWVVDEEKLVYKFSEERNLYRDLPKFLGKEGWTYVLGVDPGWEDDNAFVLCGFHENDPHLWIMDVFKHNHWTFDQVAEKIKTYMLGKTPPSKVIIDVAAKQGVETMRARTSIPFEYADKSGKVEFIEILNADLIQEKIKIHVDCRELIDEIMGLVWLTDGDKIRLPKKEHPACPNHLTDALLYSWRNAFHYHHSDIEEVIPVGSRKWYEKQAENIWEKEKEHLIQQQNDGWPEFTGEEDPAMKLLRKYGV